MTMRTKQMVSGTGGRLLLLSFILLSGLTGCAGQGKSEAAKAVQVGEVLSSEQADITLRDIQIRSEMKSADETDDSMIYLRIFLDVDNKEGKDVKLDRILRVTASADGQESKDPIILIDGSEKNKKSPSGVSPVEYGFPIPKDSRNYEVSFKAGGQFYKINFKRGESLPGQQEVPFGESFTYEGSLIKLENLEVSDEADLGKTLPASSGMFTTFMIMKPSGEGDQLLHISGTLKNESGTDWDKDQGGWGQMLLTADGDVYYAKMVDNSAEKFQVKAGEEKEFHLLFNVPKDLNTDGLQLLLYKDNVYTYVDRTAFSEKLHDFLTAPDGNAVASAGTIEGNQYTNSFLGFTITAPDGWQLYGPDEIAGVSGDGSSMESNQKDWDIGYLFYASDSSNELNFMQMEVIPLRFLGNSLTAEEFTTTYIETSAFVGGLLSMTKFEPYSSENQEISGHQIIFTEGITKLSQMKPPFGSYSSRTCYGAFAKKGYMIMCQIESEDDQGRAAAMAALKGISFEARK